MPSPFRSLLTSSLSGARRPLLATGRPTRRLLQRAASTAAPSKGLSRLTSLSVALATAALTTFYLASHEPLALDSKDSGSERIIDFEEVQIHNSEASSWVVIDGVVWDVTEFLQAHPAGAEVIVENAGKDISSIFKTLHPGDTLSKVKSQIHRVGILSATSGIEVSTPPDVLAVEARRAALLPPNYVINLGEFEELAERVLGKTSTAWSFFYSWADDGASFKAARESWSFLRFLPRVNRPVRDVDSATSFLSNGQTVPLPIFLAPTGGSGLAHPDGEFNLTRAAAKTMIPQCVSAAASKSILEVLDERDEIVKKGGAKAPIWYQIYIRSNRKDSEDLLSEVAKKGVDAIVITVDVPVLGNRESHAKEARRKAIETGSALEEPSIFSGAGNSLAGHLLFDPNMSWADIAWVRKFVPGVPVLVKGINTVADVELAKKHGADGVVISNHGARQLDHTTPPLATLVRVYEESPHLLKDPTFEVFIDGGVTRGTDVLKALCLGAKGVGIGRTMLYAQACYGEEGVLRACELFATEIHKGMRLLGVTSLKELKPEMIEVMDGLVGKQLKSR